MKMRNLAAIRNAVAEDSVPLQTVYGNDSLERASKRLIKLTVLFEKMIGEGDAMVISSPGRAEIGGNHTDHQGGCVLAAAVDVDSMAIIRPNKEGIVRYFAEGYDENPVPVLDLEPDPGDRHHTAGLIKGVLAGFEKEGYTIGGFDIVSDNHVLPGSGMSSSASFEVLIGTALNHLYNHGRVTPAKVAEIGQFAEQSYFGKPCGLMDQMTCSVGGLVFIDFGKGEAKVRKISYDFAKAGCRIVLTNCGSSHAGLTEAYAAIPSEMRSIAACLGKTILSECTLPSFMTRVEELRLQCGDRAVLRAFHYFNETRRAEQEAEALAADDFETFISIFRASGHSSYEYLQNVVLSGNIREQPLAVGLAMSQEILGPEGAWRVHGGGFAGTIMAIVPDDKVMTYCKSMEKLFGKECCYELNVRESGGVRIY